MEKQQSLDALGDWVRTNTLGELTQADDGKLVTLMGWVHGRRDHGNVIFLDLRDRYGATQIVLDPSISPNAHQMGESVRSEYVLAVAGKVRKRPEGMINPALPTGGVEVLVSELKLLNRAQTPPYQIHETAEVSESLRLKYRFLELRKQTVRNRIVERAKIVKEFRKSLEAENFLDIETPYLYKSTPEGAREFIVPSRHHPGSFYALPQSPQLFKQVLMVAGFDRYYQVVKCFRDEDLRADRQPEFTQIDCEMSFSDQGSVMGLFERVVKSTLKNRRADDFLGGFSANFAKISYKVAIDRYGTDKPDMRFGLEIEDLSQVMANTEFKVFTDAINNGGIVNAIVIKGAGKKLSRKDFDELTQVAVSLGAKGMAWAKTTSESGVEKWQSPISKFLGEKAIEEAVSRLNLEPEDVLVFGAGPYLETKRIMGGLRQAIAKRLELIDEKTLAFLWVVDFPLFERSSAGRLVAVHHPFTAPLPEDLSLLENEPEKVRASAYDLVLNGHEVAGGSIRIHDQSLQEKVFKILGITDREVEEKFGFLIEALKYGAPPHGGIAFGLDRLVMVLTGAENIREVIAFPKNHRAACLMTGSPGIVPREDLRDLAIKTQIPEV